MTHPYRLLGGPGSPYSLKMRAILRYRRLPHVWLVPRGYLATEGELAESGKKIIPVLQYPDGGYRADTTPMAYDLEAREPGGRAIIPDDPAQAFLAHLIEDMADELLVQAMFDLRWNSPEDQRFCALRQMSGWLSPMPKAEFEATVQRFIDRQTAQRARMVQGDDSGTRQVLREVYTQVLDAVEAMLERSLFLFGGRPSLADFGLYGQLSQCAIDPSASAIMRARAPRCFQWVQTLDDCSGITGDWLAPDAPNPAITPLLALAGGLYLPYLVANADAVLRGDAQLVMLLAGHTWRGHPAPYKRKCLTWLRRELAALPGPARDRVQALLAPHDAWAPLQACEAQDAGVPDMAPM
jgi:glutathione S-transferase